MVDQGIGKAYAMPIGTVLDTEVFVYSLSRCLCMPTVSQILCEVLMIHL